MQTAFLMHAFRPFFVQLETVDVTATRAAGELAR